MQPRRIIVLAGEVLAGVEVIAGGATGAAALFAPSTSSGQAWCRSCNRCS